jgi:hypothetical protein
MLTSGFDPRFLATAVIVVYHVLELKSIPSIVESLQEGHYGVTSHLTYLAMEVLTASQATD